MKRLIPTSKFRGKKDNSDSLKARKRIKGADKVNLGLLNRAETAWMALDDDQTAEIISAVYDALED